MSAANTANPMGLAPPERDRLYREWVLPNLLLTEEHRQFATEFLCVPDGVGMYTHPGSLKVPLDERAPVKQLEQLPCCMIRGNTMTLAGPREGCLLLPVTDPRGRISAFQMLSNTQVDAIRQGQPTGPVRWWQAAGVIRPMLPNGELPIHAERGHDSDCVVLAHGPAAASSIARRWSKHAISTTDETFPPSVLGEYLKEFHAKEVHILVHREMQRKECLHAWELAQMLHANDWKVRMLVPLLSDENIPDSHGDCSALSIECWYEGQPRGIRNMIVGKAKPGKLNQQLKRINEIRRITATSKIRAAYEDILHAGDSTSINGLARAAGVDWRTVREWLREQGIDSTASLRNEMEDGWLPDRPIPALPAEETPRRHEPVSQESDEDLPLFAFAEGRLLDPEPEPEEPEDAEPVAGESGSKELEPANKEPVKAKLPPESEDHPGEAKLDGTVELVVEAKESVLEEETPLTTTIREEDMDSERPSPVRERILRARILTGIFILCLAAILLVLHFGRKNKVTAWDLPSEERLIELSTPAEGELLLLTPIEEDEVLEKRLKKNAPDGDADTDKANTLIELGGAE